MTEYSDLSVHELQAVIDNAEKALKNKQFNKRKEVISKIKELAASIDIIVEILEPEKRSVRKGSKVAIKYRHPDDPTKTWTGRGVAPKWLRELMDTGRERSEFELKS